MELFWWRGLVGNGGRSEVRLGGAKGHECLYFIFRLTRLDPRSPTHDRARAKRRGGQSIAASSAGRRAGRVPARLSRPRRLAPPKWPHGLHSSRLTDSAQVSPRAWRDK